MDHFHSLLSGPVLDQSEAIQIITRHIPHLVIRDQNLALMRVVTLEEIEEVVKGMAKNKSLGLDGFTKYLFQAS